MICIRYSSSDDFIANFFGLMIEVRSSWLCMKKYFINALAVLNFWAGKQYKRSAFSRYFWHWHWQNPKNIYAVSVCKKALAPPNPHMSEEEEKSDQEPRFVIGFYEGKIDSHDDLISCSNLQKK